MNFKAIAFALFLSVNLANALSFAYVCDLTEVDLNATPKFRSKLIPKNGSIKGDMYPDVLVTLRQTPKGSMHINISSATKPYVYAEGFGQVNAGVTAFLERDNDARQVIVLCNDLSRVTVKKP